MQTIVITGSTRGIGFGLAEAFLERGHNVIISGRDPASVEQAVRLLQGKHGSERVEGYACDVRDFQQVQALWVSAMERFGRIDIWVNNAGYSGPQEAIWKIDPVQAKSILETNLLGTIHGAMVAVEGMLAQGSGSLYNMEGMGSDGRKHDGLSLYGTSKYGVRYFTQSLAQELRDTPLVVSALSPGMVVTEMITKPYENRPEEWERVKKIFNIIASRVEEVTPWLADQMLKNQKSGARLQYSSSLKLMGRFLLSPFSKRNLFD